MEAELRAHMAAGGLGGRLPTSRQLRAAGANALDVAVTQHGGFHVFSERLQCAWSPAKPFLKQMPRSRVNSLP